MIGQFECDRDLKKMTYTYLSNCAEKSAAFFCNCTEKGSFPYNCAKNIVFVQRYCVFLQLYKNITKLPVQDNF